MDSNDIKAAIISMDAVVGTSDWTTDKHDRTYLALDGASGRYRGDTSYQIYFDNRTGKLVSECGRGTTSSDFDVSLAAVTDEYERLTA